MWYFWIDQRRKGKIHAYAGEFLGGGHVPLKTGCGRTFLAKEANIVSDGAVKILRGRICRKCFPTVRAEEAAEALAR